MIVCLTPSTRVACPSPVKKNRGPITFARNFSNIYFFFLKILPWKEDQLVMGGSLTDRYVLERTFPEEHLNLSGSGFIRELD